LLFPTKVVLHFPSVAEDIDGAAERMLLAAKADSRLTAGPLDDHADPHGVRARERTLD